VGKRIMNNLTHLISQVVPRARISHLAVIHLVTHNFILDSDRIVEVTRVV